MTSESQKTARLSNYVTIIKSALKGEEYDYTSINLRKAVFLLAIPMILELSLESVFAVVDMFFLANWEKMQSPQ